MGPQDQQHQQQARRTHHLGEMRRRAAHLTNTGVRNSSMDGNTITQEQSGAYAGFNGIVFGSGGQSDLAGSLGLRMGFDSGSVTAAGPGAGAQSASAHDSLGIHGHQGMHRLSEPHTLHIGHPRQSHTATMDQMAVLFKENQMLRRQNQSLLAASDARQKAVVGLLKETLGGKYDTDKAESESGDNDEHQKQQTRNQLVQLLLALLETPSDQSQQTASKGPQQLASTAFPNSDDATASSSGMQQRQPQEKSDQYSSSMPDVQPDNVSRCTEQQNSHSSGSEVANNIRKSSLSSGSSITGSQQLDWDTTALREIADQGRVPDGEMRADKYANETRKAIGIHTQNSMIRRNKSLGRRRSSLISHNSATSPNAEPKSFSKTGSNIPGTFPLNNLNPSTPSSPAYDNTGFSPLASEKIPKEPVVMNDSEMGPLAASMLAPSELQFEPDLESRFVLYSPSAGIYESDHLHGLRSGDMTLADIVEASSRLLTLDHLRMERAGKQADYRLSQPPSSDSNEGCFWIDVTDPTPEEMASLARVFGIHPLTVEDIMADEDGRDKFETFTGYNFMMYRTIDYGEDARSTYEFNRGSEGIATASFAIILKQSCVLTFHRARGIGHVGNVISRLRELAPFDNSTGECISPHVITPAYIAYTLIDDITDTLAPEMRSVELEVDAVDELVLILSTNEQADMLKRIGSARRKILTIWRLLQGKPEVIKAFSKLMERHAAVDDMIRAEIEEAEYMRRMMDPAANVLSDSPANVPVAAADVGSTGGLPGHSMPSSVLASPQSTLRRSATSSTAIAQMALGMGANSSAGAARRKDVPLWPAYITGAMGTKDARVPSTRPSTADLSTGAGGARVDAEAPVTAQEVSHYLSDVYDHLVSLSGSSSHCDMVLSRAHSNYLARISLGLGESTVETNMFASRWTVIGAILVPLNVVTGLWGMNVKVPGGDREDLRDFFLILGGCMAFVVAVIVWAKYKKIF